MDPYYNLSFKIIYYEKLQCLVNPYYIGDLISAHILVQCLQAVTIKSN